MDVTSNMQGSTFISCVGFVSSTKLNAWVMVWHQYFRRVFCRLILFRVSFLVALPQLRGREEVRKMVLKSDFSDLPCLWSRLGERNLNHISWDEESLDDAEIACFASLIRKCMSLLNLWCPTQTPVCVNSTLNSWHQTVSTKIILMAWLYSFLPLLPVH